MALRDRETVTQAFYLLVDGLPYAWFTREDAASSVTLTGRTKLVGLREPSYEYSIDLREGWYQQGNARLVIDDVNEQLAALFASIATDVTPLANTLGPLTTAAATEYSKHVGHEFIGPAGERHQYPWHPDDTVGLQHASQDAAESLEIAAAPVSSSPVIISGRRFGLYRTLRKDDGTWQQHDAVSESSELVYWGTLRDQGSVRGRTWTLSAGGPESLLQRTLGTLAPGVSYRAQPTTKLEASERSVYVSMAMGASGYLFNADEVNQADGYVWPPQAGTASSGSFSDIRSAVATAITAALDVDRNGTTPGTTDEYGDIAGISQPGASMDSLARVNVRGIVTDQDIRYGIVNICLHERAWGILGYQVQANGDAGAGDLDWRETKYVRFRKLEVSGTIDGVEFGDGYWVGAFIGANPGAETSNQLGVGGRTTEPFFSEGASTWPAALDQSPVEFDLITFDTLYLQTQNDAPPAEDPDAPGTAYALTDVGDVNSTRLVMIDGLIRLAGTDEERQYAQVLRASWVGDGETVSAASTTNRPRMVGTRWLPTYLYGIENETIKAGWVSAVNSDVSTRATPINSWSHSTDGYASQVHQVAQQVLMSTGTGTGWKTTPGFDFQGFGNGNAGSGSGGLYVEPGDYDPGIGTPKDREIADLGLGIPPSLVARPEEWASVVQGLDLPDAYNVIVARLGPILADELLRGLTSPLGLCWTLRGGKYGIIDPWRPTSSTDFDITIGAGDLLRADGVGTSDQEIRALAPVDRVVVNWREKLTQPGSYLKTETVRATDRSARYRSTGAEHTVNAPWHVKANGIIQRWKDLGFEFWARRHFVAKGLRVGRIPGQDLYPGTRVLLTDPWLVSQTGAYGITSAPGLVLSVAVDHDAEVYTFDVLVYEPQPEGSRVMAPEARAYAYDSSTYVLSCLLDYRGIGGTHNDLTAFVKPAWASGLSGDLAIQVRQGTRANPTQYDTLTGSVSAIDTDAGTITLTGALSGGTWRRDAIHLVTIRPYANQVEWARRVFYPIAAEAGTVGGSSANAVTLPEI